MLAAVALLLPAIIVLAVWFNEQLSEQRRQVEREALDTARQVLALTDAELAANKRVLEVIAGSPTLRAPDLVAFAPRVQKIVDDSPDWNAVVVRDAVGGKVLMEVARSGEGTSGAFPAARLVPRSGTAIARAGKYCPCVMMTVRAPEGGRIVTVFLRPDLFQRIVTDHAKPGSIAAVVDHNGLFVARSLAFRERVGTLGSTFLRTAVERGGEGIYRGVTLEGFKNYTAYTSSAQSGWSAHIAIDPSRIDRTRTWSSAAVATAILAALILAAGLSFYAAYETRRRRLEEQRLIGMQKAEAISRFTGTMTHDFRNILSVIDAGVRLILRHTEEELTAKRANAIGEAVERGNRLINQLLSFVRGDGAQVTALDLTALIGGADDLLERSLGDGIAFTWHVEEEARYARGNADQIELALLNLAINARDAMDGSGEFSIVATRADDMCEIRACDNGPGVPSALRERIFETFYSTKGTGKGTGLGLAQVAGAARQAGGKVALREREGGGACFVICLPLGTPPDGAAA